MSDSMDLKAALSSEIFREYATNELARKAREERDAAAKQARAAEEELSQLEQFATMEMEIKESPKKLAAFKALQEKFASDPAYTAKVNPLFVQAVMMLKLD